MKTLRSFNEGLKAFEEANMTILSPRHESNKGYSFAGPYKGLDGEGQVERIHRLSQKETPNMKSRYLLVFSAMLALSACGDKKNEGDAVQTGGQDFIPADSGMGTTYDPGTEGDFINNVGDRVFFDLDSVDLRPEARSTLENQARWLQQYSNLNVTIEGHADERGTREYNLALGERRANTVKNYLVALGIDGARINTISYGKERPDQVGADESSWARNRRGVTDIQ